MKTEMTTDICDRTPARVDLDARYKGIGIAAVAAAVRYTGGAAAEQDRDGATRTRPEPGLPFRSQPTAGR